MSYIVYINGQQVNTTPINFARTLQVNDIANLVSRNSNYTQSIKIKRTGQNKRIFENAFNIGTTAEFPYKRAKCEVIDTDTGQHVIYDGWAVLLDSSKDEYSITIYDGSIDFYRSIENITLTEIGVSELNHIKTLETVVGSWNDDLPYRYILADYNGDNFTGANINIDFQVPSASVPYLWNKIFEFIGFDYVGSIFSHEKFTNLWLTYPKPVSVEEPIFVDVTEQTSEIVINNTQFPYGGGTYFGTVVTINLFPDANGFDSDYYIPTIGNGIQVFGVYRYTFTPTIFTADNPNRTSGVITWTKIDAVGQITSGTLDISLGNYIDFTLNVGDRVIWTTPFVGGSQFPTSPFVTITGETTATMQLITGYSLGFDQAFIDFKVSDFVREIMIRFGLTPFKDKYSNTVTFLTLSELLQNQNINDLSDKYNGKVSEKYTFGNYAKSNLFNYKYNDDEAKHNNGSFVVDNENLAEETTILNSRMYSPDRLRSTFLSGSNVYPIWSRQIKEDETIEYKGLDNRFYFMRADKKTETITVGSDLLGGTITNNPYYRESYYRLPFQDILDDWYRPMKAIFDKARLVTAEFNFKPVDVYNFDFSRPIYIEQLGSYYLMNKINNFVKFKPTKCELIEVDYLTEFEPQNPITPINYDITITGYTIDDCEITFNVATSYPLPCTVELVAYAGGTNVLSEIVYTQAIEVLPQTQTLSGGTVTFDLSQFPANLLGYKFALKITTDNFFINYISNLSEVVTVDGSCYVAPDFPDTLTINSVVNLGQNPNSFFPNEFRYDVDYSYSGMPTSQAYLLECEGFGGFSGGWHSIGSFSKVQGLDGTQIVSGIALTKIRFRINGVVSNEFTV